MEKPIDEPSKMSEIPKMDEPLIEPINNGFEFSWAMIMVVTILAVLAGIAYWVLRSKKRRTTYLLVGLSDSGKTHIFTKLINRGKDFLLLICFDLVL